MQRVYGLVAEGLVPRIQHAADEAELSRAQWIRIAIESYLNNDGENGGIDPVKLREETENLRIETVNLQAIVDEQSQRIAHLTDNLAEKSGELEKDRVDAEQRWRELKEARSEVLQLKRELETYRMKMDHAQTELDKKRSEAEAANRDMEKARHERDRLADAIRLKDDEIGFLRAHIGQLSEKITPALPPSQEESRKRGWRRFWRW